MLSKSSIIRNQYENVTSPDTQKNLKKIKYIKKQNYIINKHTIDRFKVVTDKDMRKISNIVENLIRRYLESRF